MNGSILFRDRTLITERIVKRSHLWRIRLEAERGWMGTIALHIHYLLNHIDLLSCACITLK